jgi:uncharacterized membrane protein YdjX (TVP38/TMEM64 family)
VLRRSIPAVLVVGTAGVVYFSGLLEQISLAGFARHHLTLQRAVDAAPTVAVVIYIVAFTVLTAACLPVALVLTLAAGALFGALIGGLATAVAATVAAVLTHLAVRTSFGPLVIGALGRRPRLDELRAKLAKNSFSFVLTTRLIPGFPFALMNIACGLAAVPLRTYVPATLVGAIPTSLIYASLGAGIGASVEQEASLSAAIRSPAVFLPLLLLAALPLLPKLFRPKRGRNSAGRTLGPEDH